MIKNTLILCWYIIKYSLSSKIKKKIIKYLKNFIKYLIIDIINDDLIILFQILS
jgi:hypothetical protein